MEVYLFTFETISMVLLFENSLKQQGVKTKLMPVPREFSSSCGSCALVEKENLEKAKEIAKNNHVFYEEIHLYKLK